MGPARELLGACAKCLVQTEEKNLFCFVGKFSSAKWLVLGGEGKIIVAHASRLGGHPFLLPTAPFARGGCNLVGSCFGKLCHKQ